MNNTPFPEPLVFVQNTEICFPVYQFDLSNEIDIDDTISKIQKLKTVYPSTTRTNVITETGWRSPYISFHEPEVQTFNDEISVIQTKLNQINSFQTKLINFWSVIYGKSDFSKSHNHFTLWDNMAYNTILYLTDSDTPIVFETTRSPVEIFPKKGLLVVMHPLTKHSVPLVSDQSERIVLVCNFGVY
jgi:hypothetical protein